MAAVEQLALLATTSFITGFSGALVPGPVFIATVVESTRRGYSAGPLIVLGHIIAEAVTIAALGLGLSLVVGTPLVRVVIGLVGGVFLILTGVDILRFARKASLQQVNIGEGFSLLRFGTIVAGILTSASNPYFLLWWVTVGNSFTLEGLRLAGLLGVVVFAFSHWMSDLVWYTFVSTSVHTGRKVMGDRVYRILLITCGLFLIGISLMFIVEGLTSLS